MQSALLQLPALDGPDLFSTISGWPSPNFSALLSWPAVGCHVAWEEGGCLLVPFSRASCSQSSELRVTGCAGVLKSSYL